MAVLREWLPAASSAELLQVQVATVDADGRPDLRTVLLSEWDEAGFVFHTDSRSRKVAQIEQNSSVAMLVLWPGFTRQLVLRGTAEPAGREQLDRAFARRPPYLRQLAWQNTAALAQRDRAARSVEWGRFARERDVATLDAPPEWTGYVVRPDRLTFWQSDADGPSHRVEYRADADGTWSEHHLPG